MAPQVTFYLQNVSTPNPLKVMILLEELGIEYVMVRRQFGNGPKGVKAPDYAKIDPNGRVPAIIDHTNDDFIVWELGAILLYLAERFDTPHKFHGTTLKERAEVWQWLILQLSGVGPVQGQVNWFLLFHPIKPAEIHPSVIERFQNETRRVYGVLEQRLAQTGEWLALGRFTVVDMAHFGWLNVAEIAKIDMDAFPLLRAYIARIKALHSVERAYAKAKPQKAA